MLLIIGGFVGFVVVDVAVWVVLAVAFAVTFVVVDVVVVLVVDVDMVVVEREVGSFVVVVFVVVEVCFTAGEESERETSSKSAVTTVAIPIGSFLVGQASSSGWML